MEFGNKLQKLRKQNNISQEELAEKVGVARQTISKWELGETSPDLKQSNKLSQIFNISLDELTGSSFNPVTKTANKNNIINIIGIVISDIFTSLFFIFLLAFLLILVLFSLTSLVLAISLIAKINFAGIIPYIPYWCSFILALSLVSLSLLSSIGSIYFYLLIKYLFNLYKNFHNKTLNKLDKIKTITLNQELSLTTKELLKKLTIIFLITFVILFIVTIICCMISSKSLSFWHTWKWFI